MPAGITADNGDNRHAHRVQRTAQHSLMPVAGDAIEHDAGNADIGPEIGKAADDRCNRLRHARTVDDEHDGKAKQGGKIGRSSSAIGSTVE